MSKYVWFNGSLEQSGGGERLSLEVIRCLREQGHEAEYVVFFYNREATFEGRYDFLNPIAMKKQPSIVNGVFFRVISRLRRLLWLRKTLKEINPICVITSGTWNQVIELYLASIFTNIPYVTHVFGSMFAFGPDKEYLKFGAVFKKNFHLVRDSMKSYQDVVPDKVPDMGFLAKIILNLQAYIKYLAVRKSKVLFVLSERNRWETKLLYGKDSIVLQGAFPKKIFDYQPVRSLKHDLGLNAHKVILFIGRLAANKRVDLALSAFSEIAAKRDDTRLVIGGSGPEADRLRRLAHDLKVADKVYFIGYVPESILWDYLADCDVFLHLDLADFDIMPLEALAMGANVVWGNEMDIPELTRRLTCLWSVEAEAPLIAQATLKAIDAGKQNMEPSALYQIMKDYSWEVYTARMTQFINEALNEAE